jgi:antitoxin (DNA-binding transcriptional repressor) of toxin-antitoxin stability system
MHTVGTRELKQNPHAVIQRVLASDEEIEITTHGRPTGVRLVADRPARARWVTAQALADLRPLAAEDAADLRALVDAARDEDDVDDPWEPRA